MGELSEVNYYYIRQLFEEAPAKFEGDGTFDPNDVLHHLTLRIEILAAILGFVMEHVRIGPEEYVSFLNQINRINDPDGKA